jgi:hypothetical protein
MTYATRPGIAQETGEPSARLVTVILLAGPSDEAAAKLRHAICEAIGGKVRFTDFSIGYIGAAVAAYLELADFDLLPDQIPEAFRYLEKTVGGLRDQGMLVTPFALCGPRGMPVVESLVRL